MTIKQQGGIFGRNPTFNNVTVDGILTVDQIVEKTGAAGITLDGVTLKDGNVVLADGKGIDFSATAGTGTSELFDDYEEGTWTPVVADATSGGNEANATSYGYYTKIGDVVFATASITSIDTTGLTAGNAVFVTGLPFLPQSLIGIVAFQGATQTNNIAVATPFSVTVTDNTTFASFLRPRNGTTTLSMKVSDMTSGTAGIQFTAIYKGI